MAMKLIIRVVYNRYIKNSSHIFSKICNIDLLNISGLGKA